MAPKWRPKNLARKPSFVGHFWAPRPARLRVRLEHHLDIIRSAIYTFATLRRRRSETLDLERY